MKALLQLPRTLLTSIFGRIDWTAPPWLQRVARFRHDSPAAFWGLGLFLVSALSLMVYLKSVPEQEAFRVEMVTPGITANHEGATPELLTLHFLPAASNDAPPADSEEGVEPYRSWLPEEPGVSVARIDLVGEVIAEGVRLEPAKPGVWRWLDDRTLQFEPETDWPPGIDYQVLISETVLKPDTPVPKQLSFSTPALSIELSNPRFYQDPSDAAIRRVVATYRFSHPIDPASFEAALELTLREDGAATGQGKAFTRSVQYDKNQREAYVLSDPVVLPERSTYMVLALQPGVRSVLGGVAAPALDNASVLIPDRFSYLKVTQAELRMERSPQNEPQQILVLELTDDIDEQVLLENLKLWLLPEQNPYNKNKSWSSPREVGDAELQQSEALKLTLIPNPRPHSRLFSFVLDVPENRYVYLALTKGFDSINGFVNAQPFDQILAAPPYPREVKISGEGSVLTQSGDHQLALVSRGVTGLRYQVGRVLEHQINHLVSQTGGDVSNPQFYNWSFTPESIAAFDEKIVPILADRPGKAVYSSLDLSPYFAKSEGRTAKPEGRFGLFFVNVTAWDIERNQEVYGVKDQRLILVTDLGVIVKKNRDQSQDVFVQSIQSGAPVAGASVRLLGKNGIALLERKTDRLGHVVLPSAADFSGARQPMVYVVQTSTDTSFIPFDRYTRQINLSRYDIGGVSAPGKRVGITAPEQNLNAFGFSDRGIYRPGETVNLGFIVKAADLSKVEDIPLELVLRSPRGNEVAVHKFNLPEKGLFDFLFPTEATAPTGSYQATLHLVRDGKHRGWQIGATDFRLEEFQPDTMKIESRLTQSDGKAVSPKGWFDGATLSAEVQLSNLFGSPAQARRVQGRLLVEPALFRFEQFDGYVFSSLLAEGQEKPLRVDEALDSLETDDSGRVRFALDLQRFKQGAYRLRFSAEGFDPAGGRSVSASNQMLIAPHAHLLAYKADGALDYVHAGSTRNVHWLAIDSTLQQIGLSGLTLRRLEVEQLSTLVRQNDGTFAYQSLEREKELGRSGFELAQSGVQLPLETQTPGRFAWEVLDAAGLRLARLDYTVVGASNLDGKQVQNSELQLALSQSDYRAGDDIEMSLQVPYDGAGLITIESDSVKQFKWFKAKAGSSLQHIRVPAELEATAYVNVAFVRDVGSKAIFSSPLSYAVAPFSIDQSQRRLEVKLEVAPLVRPGMDMVLQYSTRQAAKIVVFAVDEGILQVANYRTPDPLSHFLQKRRLEVSTMQMLDLILPDFGMLKKLSASGGDAMAEMAAMKMLAHNLNPFSRKTDEPVAIWSGVLDAGPVPQELIFGLPDTFSGALRVMAVAVGDAALGRASSATVVRGPFVISPSTLTQAAPGDEFDVTVGVANLLEGSGQNAALTLAVETSEHLELLGEKSTLLQVAEGSEGQARFRVLALDKLGAASLRFSVQYQDEVARRTATLSVRPATPYVTDFVSGRTHKGAARIAQTRLRYESLADQSIAASASPLVLVDGLSAYLEHFPHGCTEQVVSRVFPLVGLMAHPAYSPFLPKIDEYFDQVIFKLRERQNGDGGFAFWPGHTSSAQYPTLYALHFLIEAATHGYAVPQDMLTRAQGFAEVIAARPTASLREARERAYAIYLLTRQGVVTSNYLVDLQESLQRSDKKLWRSDLLAVYMAATWQLLQKQDEAMALLKGFDLKSIQVDPHDDFHTRLAQSAQYVYLLARHFDEQARALDDTTLQALIEPIFQGEYNTLSAAYSILALGAYSALVLPADSVEQIAFAAGLRDGSEQQLASRAVPFAKAFYPLDATSIQVDDQGDRKNRSELFYLNVVTGFDTTLPTQALSEGIEVYRDFLDADGKVVTEAQQGQLLTVRLKVRALDQERLTNIAVIDLLPGGFEVVADSVARTAFNWRADYVDVREDRVVYYGSFDGSVRELRYQVKATASGSFVVPSTSAASMYDRSLRAVSLPERMTVTPAPKVASGS